MKFIITINFHLKSATIFFLLFPSEKKNQFKKQNMEKILNKFSQTITILFFFSSCDQINL